MIVCDGDSLRCCGRRSSSPPPEEPRRLALAAVRARSPTHHAANISWSHARTTYAVDGASLSERRVGEIAARLSLWNAHLDSKFTTIFP